MEQRKDPMEEIIVEDLLYEAERIDKELEGQEIIIPEGVEEEVLAKLHEQIDEYERKRIYAQLSEEDRRALELGKEMLKDRADDTKDKVVYRKKHKKVYAAVAAVAVLVLAMGATSMGGAERIAEMIGIKVGTREVVQVNTDEDNYIVSSDNEEEAYQELKDVFGVDPVRISLWPGNVKFLKVVLDEELQTATLVYEYEGEMINYFISSHYTDSSWGRDVEDTVISKYTVQHEKKGDLEIQEYEIKEKNQKRYSTHYTHDGLEYFIIGTMEKSEFEYLVKNLKFFKETR